MIIINRENLKPLMKVIFKYGKSMTYNPECFSASDVRSYTNAYTDINKILSLLIDNGVNIEKELSHLCESGDRLNNSDNLIEQSGDFEIEFKSNKLDNYLKAHYPEHFVENKEIIKKTKMYDELDIGDSRFSYQLWNGDKETVEYLKEKCSVFKSASEIIDRMLTYYNYDIKIAEIHCIRDVGTLGNTNPNRSNCSSYMIRTVLNNPNEKRNSDNILLIHDGGFYSDALLYNERRKVMTHSFLLEESDKWRLREYSTKMSEKCAKSVSRYDEYKERIKNNI